MYRTIIAAGALVVAAAQADERLVVNDGTPRPDCTLHVNYDRNLDLPGYVSKASRGAPCLPFTVTNRLKPRDYAGDYYVDAFTDAMIRQRWEACRPNPACADPVLAGVKPFIAFERRLTGSVDPAGRPGAEGDIDVKAVRRPGFFARAPYNEPVAAAEPGTFAVEFTVPRDAIERRQLGKTDPIRLHGWYMVGAGVPNPQGGRTRALVIMNNGGGSEITALDDPSSPGAVLADGKWVAVKYPDAQYPDAKTELSGMRHWRGFLALMNAAGLDVLVTDRRGNGISGGVRGFNTTEQANDIFRELDQLATGEGMRAATPAGAVLEGRAAASAALAGADIAAMPIVVGGYSRGSYATAWFMHKNFVADCDRDLPGNACRPPRGRANVKGAILYGPNSAGLGYRLAGHDLIEAALRSDHDTTYYPDGEVFAGVARWPALQIVKGIWDYVEGLEGSLEAYRRATGPKDFFVFRGPHVLGTQAPENMRLAGERMAAFAAAVAVGAPITAAQPSDLRFLVLSSPDVWELTTAPR